MGANRKAIFGVGINDAEYSCVRAGYEITNGVRKKVTYWTCPFYAVWISMLIRCYSPQRLKIKKTYSECLVCEEWLMFSNFKRWMEQKDWQGKDLDKDLLKKGNKLYSPDLCVFITPELNNFICDTKSKKSSLPIGVALHKATGRYYAYCQNPFTKRKEHLGSFTCSDKAHKAWLKRKNEHASKLASEINDQDVKLALVARYAA